MSSAGSAVKLKSWLYSFCINVTKFKTKNLKAKKQVWVPAYGETYQFNNRLHLLRLFSFLLYPELVQPSLPLIGKGIVALTSASFDIPQKVLKTLMIRPHPRSMKSESLNVGPGIIQAMPMCQGWKRLLQKAGPVPPGGWYLPAPDHKPEEGCREAEACSKNSDQESEESALWYRGPGKGCGEEETLGSINGTSNTRRSVMWHQRVGTREKQISAQSQEGLSYKENSKTRRPWGNFQLIAGCMWAQTSLGPAVDRECLKENRTLDGG